MAIRFSESDARPMGRNTSGVKGIRLRGDDRLVGMVVADPEATLLTACANGYGKRTLFGPNSPLRPRPAKPAAPTAAKRIAADDEADEEPSSRRSRPTRTKKKRRRSTSSQPLPHPAPRRQGPARHQNHRSQRPGDRHRRRARRRRAADDDRPRQDPAHRRRRDQRRSAATRKACGS